MNTAYIRAKVKAYPRATPTQQIQIIRDIGVAAGLLSARDQNRYLPPVKADEVRRWLRDNQVMLKLPPVEV
ncbi:MAG TPA: hypothetical protein V6D26_09925 [Stenomitos sp.]